MIDLGTEKNKDKKSLKDRYSPLSRKAKIALVSILILLGGLLVTGSIFGYQVGNDIVNPEVYSQGAIDLPNDVEISTPDDVENNVLSFPAKYDLRDKGLVSTIKNQGQFGTCWTFAALGALESSYLKRDPAVDLSEAQLAWFNYTGSNAFFPSPPDGIYDQGGTIYMPLATYSKGWGVANELDIPYSLAGTALDESLRQIQSFNLTNAKYLWNGKHDLDQSEMIKRALTNDESVILNISSMSTDPKDYNLKTGAYYSQTTDVGHAVLCVGWDDNYSKDNFNPESQPENDGAWIIKNSYSIYNGLDGYYYVSYEDASITNWISFDMEPTSQPEKPYVYSELGYAGSPIGANDKETVANIYRPDSANEALSSVGIYTTNHEINCTVSIYTNLTNPLDPKSGVLAYSDLHYVYNAGYQKIELPNTIALGGEPYSVVIEYQATTEPDDPLIPVESLASDSYQNLVLTPNVSFKLDEATQAWTDFKDLNIEDIGNLCLNVNTVEVDTVRFALGSGNTIAGDKEWLSAGASDLILYTTDGSDPGSTSPFYNAATGIELDGIETIKAAVFKNSTIGPVAVAEYLPAKADVVSFLIKDEVGRKYYYDLDKISQGISEQFIKGSTFIDITPISTGTVEINGTVVPSNSSIRIPINGSGNINVDILVEESGKLGNSYQLSFEEMDEVLFTYDYVNEVVDYIKDGWVLYASRSNLTPVNVGDSITPFIGTKMFAFNFSEMRPREIQVASRPAAPPLPVLLGSTKNDCTLQNVDGVEYKLNAGIYQPTPYFKGLTPNTTYQVTQRYRAQEEISFASEEATIDVKTLAEDSSNKDKTLVYSLPKTGGYGALLVSLFAIGSGLLVSSKRIKK